MTPEQKAFYEYGRARGWLKAHRSKKYFVDVPDMGLYAWHLERDMHGLDRLIRDAWQKRAVCRIKCGQCVHFSADEWGPRRDGCLKRCCGVKSARCAVGCRYWEPRKEGE